MHDPMTSGYADLYRRTMLAAMLADARGLSEMAARLYDAAAARPPDLQHLTDLLRCEEALSSPRGSAPHLRLVRSS